MSVRFLVMALSAGFLVVPAADADNAQRRDGGSQPSSPSAGAHHPSPSSGGVHSSGGSSSGSGSGWSAPSDDRSSRSGAHYDRAIAERRHPRAGTGTGSRPGYGYYPGYYYPGYYYPGWYYPYWPSYYYGAYSYGSWPYGYYGSSRGYYSHRTGPDTAALRVLVDPEKTRVFVDGYYAGVADDFDGIFQRLHLSPGRHEITLKLDGFRPHRVLVYLFPGQTLKLEHDMHKGTGAETFEDLTGGRGDREVMSERSPEGEDEGEYDRPAPDERKGDRPFRPEAGRLRLEVRPADASVYVDGQFRGTAAQLGELVVPPGPHRIEVVRPGFRTEERDVDLEPGSSRELTIELLRP